MITDAISVDEVDLLAYDFNSKDGKTRQALNNRVYSILREALISGAFPPGSLLSIRPIANQLGMSTMPIREALSMLKSDGALESTPNRAFRVPIISSAMFRETLLIRLSLECALGERAAAIATSDDLRRVSDAYKQMIEAETGPIEHYLKLHRKFHRSIYQIAQMPLIQRTVESVWVRVGPLLLASTRGRLVHDRSRHYAILRSLKSGDPRGTSESLHNDILDSLDLILDYLDSMDTQQRGRAHGGASGNESGCGNTVPTAPVRANKTP